MARQPDSEPGDPAESTLGPEQSPFARLLGGTRGALESVLPPLVFVTIYFALGADAEALGWAIGSAVALALVFTTWRIIEGKHPARALGSLLLVLVSAYIAGRTGSAADFFWPRVLLNAASGLAFVFANVIRWPLIGVVLGPLVGTRFTWRKDPDLLRAYSRASWPWAVLNFLRAVLLALFIDGDNLWALAVSGAFFYALTILTIIVSWRVIRRSLPADHPGIRRPRIQVEGA